MVGDETRAQTWETYVCYAGAWRVFLVFFVFCVCCVCSACLARACLCGVCGVCGACGVLCVLCVLCVSVCTDCVMFYGFCVFRVCAARVLCELRGRSVCARCSACSLCGCAFCVLCALHALGTLLSPPAPPQPPTIGLSVVSEELLNNASLSRRAHPEPLVLGGELVSLETSSAFLCLTKNTERKNTRKKQRKHGSGHCNLVPGRCDNCPDYLEKGQCGYLTMPWLRTQQHGFYIFWAAPGGARGRPRNHKPASHHFPFSRARPCGPTSKTYVSYVLHGPECKTYASYVLHGP